MYCETDLCKAAARSGNQSAQCLGVQVVNNMGSSMLLYEFRCSFCTTDKL